MILDKELKNQLQREYKSFLSSESTYRDLGVPWKRGIIFLGPPGNGKTISLKAIMKDSGVPTLYVKTFQSESLRLQLFAVATRLLTALPFSLQLTPATRKGFA